MRRSWSLGHIGALVILLVAGAMAQSGPPVDSRVLSSATGPQASPAPRAAPATPPGVLPPTEERSIKFAVLGDTGTGERAQYDVAAELAKARAIFPFEFVIMLGDNMYGSERPQDFQRKFELPYKPILDANVPFYASLGNHDDPNQRFYKPFNMNGERYYTFKKDKLGSPGARFFVLDSNYMTTGQVQWLDKELAGSGEPWKIAYFHHPIYSSGGRHGSEVDLRTQIEPLFIKHGMNVVFAGHEHFYERLRPQKGISYFTAGGSAKLRVGDITKTAMTAFGFDTDYTFMLVELTDEAMTFQTLTRRGRRIDSGSIARTARTPTQQ